MALTKVSTPAIKDEAITLAKLLHGDSNSNGKFLRANNGADPTFETIDLTALSASNLTSGTIPDARFPATLPAVSAANLTSIPAGNLTGTVADARISALTASKLTGALPAIDGSNLTGITSTNISGNANNRIITGSDTANTLNADADVTYDASTSDFSILASKPGVSMDLIVQNNGGGNAAGARLTLQSGNASNTGPQFGMLCNGKSWYLQTPKNVGALDFHGNGTRTFRLLEDGHVEIADGDLTLGTNGHGIDFYGGSGSYRQAANTLDDYEEGTFTPNIQGTGSNNSKSYTQQKGKYTRIGNIVHCEFRIGWNNAAVDSGIAIVNGLPFSIDNSPDTGAAIGSMACNNMNFPNGDVITSAWEAANGQQYVYFLVSYDNGGWSNPTTGMFNNTGNIRGAVTYRIL